MTTGLPRILVFTNMYPFDAMPFYGSFVFDEVSALKKAGCSVDVLFVNGIKLVGLLPLPLMQAIIDGELGR